MASPFTEEILRNNSPAELFKVPTGEGKPTSVRVRLLSCSAGEEWASQWQPVLTAADLAVQAAQKAALTARPQAVPEGEEDAPTAADTLRNVQHLRAAVLRDALKAYAHDVFSEDVLDAMTEYQLQYAYAELHRHTDPTQVGVVLQATQIANMPTAMRLAAEKFLMAQSIETPTLPRRDSK